MNCIHRALSSSSKWKHDVYASAQAGGAGRRTQCCKAAEAFHWWQFFSQCVPVGVWVDSSKGWGGGGWTKKLNSHHPCLHNGTLASGQREHLNSGKESRPSCLGLSWVNTGTQGWGTRHYPPVGQLFGGLGKGETPCKRVWGQEESLCGSLLKHYKDENLFLKTLMRGYKRRGYLFPPPTQCLASSGCANTPCWIQIKEEERVLVFGIL